MTDATDFAPDGEGAGRYGSVFRYLADSNREFDLLIRHFDKLNCGRHGECRDNHFPLVSLFPGVNQFENQYLYVWKVK